MKSAEPVTSKDYNMFDRARTALLHGTPEQRFNMAAIITDHLAQLRSSSETPAGAWLPIETAPSDGTEFIVFHKEAGVCACFRTGPESSWYCMDGWNTYVNADGSKRPGLTSFVDPPERWMPMPKPPSQKASESLDPNRQWEAEFEARTCSAYCKCKGLAARDRNRCLRCGKEVGPPSQNGSEQRK